MSDPATPPKDEVKETVPTVEGIAFQAFGIKSGPRTLRLLDQTLRTVRTEASPDSQTQALVAIVSALESIKPEDELERMLAAQMVGTHEQAMECLSRAAISGQTFEGRDLNLKHAEKLLQIYTRQVEALDKHRGKGQQKITVEHVTVEAGGQAIVGNVETTRAKSANLPAPAALEHMPDDSVPIDFAPAQKEPVPVLRAGKQRPT